MIRRLLNMFSTSQFALGCCILLQVMTSAMTQEKVRMCYFTNWSQYRAATGRFTPANVDPFLCTHIVCAFAHVDAESNGVKYTEPNDAQMYRQIVELKQVNPSLKVLLALGGGSHRNEAFLETASSKGRVSSFAENVVQFLRHNGFDGLTVDWHRPTNHTKETFQTFLGIMSLGMKTESVKSGKAKLLMGMAVAGDHEITETHYGPRDMFLNFVDYVLLMSYDLWGAWASTLGHHSPLNVLLPGHPEQGRYSMTKVVEEWARHGVPKSKIVLGMATYGHTGQLTSANYHSPGDFWTRQLGTAGPVTRITGYLAYFEICDKLKSPDWNSEFDLKGQVPFAWNPKTLQYVCYDDPQSYRAKAQYIVNEGLAGAMLWSLDYDDFTGQHCNDGPYPLIRRVKDVLVGASGNADAPAAPDTNPQAPDTVHNGNVQDNNNHHHQQQQQQQQQTAEEHRNGAGKMPMTTVRVPQQIPPGREGGQAWARGPQVTPHKVSMWTVCMWVLVALGVGKVLVRFCPCSQRFRSYSGKKFF